MVSLLCPFFAVTECASIGVARGGTGADTLGYNLLRMGTHKRLVSASEQSRSGDGIASAGVTSGESRAQKWGNFPCQKCFIICSKTGIHTLLKDDE